MGDLNGIWSFMDIIFAGAGVYGLYSAILLKTTGEIKTAFLMNKDVDLKKCRDLEGYKAYVFPRLIVFGAVALLYGGFGLVNTYVMPMPTFLYYFMMVLFFCVLVWFAIQTRNALNKFW